ncbi:MULTISPECIES: hypothetical protein [Methylobacterium]|jgi:hypothetical protein|uniref:Uncharacterized protein n=3 Tax=Methylobacterium TaxID=407 RepID=A0AAE8HQT5_9HYPH|nr:MULTISPECIES: hypothetical protein [Methylobacterium]KOX56871.1 hypothetical protein ADL19_09775 [Streptomyces purpurogeneiscleroticus]AIQ93481.1 protein of unassigned function [Methylobacterium oryzae CBMB20]APT33759.1 hypothetical protein MCBMB27_04468 [Methylobacterium phyllosphaerae]AWV15122.1 hypothetical protein A3862_06000 [Methylobacterium sp. XJLW]MBA9061117.1 hypothetical protein [Methylobacterium fujisawaense]
MSHKFKIGQRVCRPRLGTPGEAGEVEVFEVLRLMPQDQTGEPSYRIRTKAGERAIREGDLVAAAQP